MYLSLTNIYYVLFNNYQSTLIFRSFEHRGAHAPSTLLETQVAKTSAEARKFIKFGQNLSFKQKS
jgi:hypothetical protein